MIGWLNTKMFDETGDEEQSQGWTALVLDTNGNGRRDAYVELDVDKALAVWQADEEVDEMYASLFRELLTYMMEDPRRITPCTHVLFIAKNVERIGDHLTNISETIYFLVHGERLEQSRPRGRTNDRVIDPAAGAKIKPEK